MSISKKDFNPAILMLLTGTTLTKAAAFLCLPFLSIFLVKRFHISPVLTGIIVGSGQISIIFGGFIGGQLSDLFGRINLLLISIFGTALAFCGFWAVSNINTFSLLIVTFFLINILNGFISSFFQPISQALMSDLSSTDMRMKIFQFRYAAINIGAAVGPFIGAVLGISASPKSFLWSSVIFCLYGLFMGIILKLPRLRLHQTPSKKVSLRDSLRVLFKDRKLRYFIISGMIFFMCYVQIECTLSQYLVINFENGIKIFAFLLCLNAITVLVCQVPVYWINKKYSPNINLIVGSVIFAIGYLLFALAKISVLLCCLAMIISSIGEIFVFPVSGIFIDNLAPDQLRGTYFGASSLRQLGMFIGPILGGIILQTLGGSWLFMIMAVLALISFFINLIGDRAEAMQIKTNFLEVE